MAIKDSALRGIEAAVLPTMKMKMSIPQTSSGIKPASGVVCEVTCQATRHMGFLRNTGLLLRV